MEREQTGNGGKVWWTGVSHYLIFAARSLGPNENEAERQVRHQLDGSHREVADLPDL